MADEELVVELPARLALGGAPVEPLPSAGEVRAVDEDLEAQHQVPAVRRQPEAADVERQVGHLDRLASCRAAAGDASDAVEAPDLGRAAPGGEKVEALPVRRPARAAF